MKVLAWLAFLGLVLAALLRKMSVTRIKIMQTGSPKQFDESGAEIMVCCAHCGVYIPSSEAIHHDNVIYCSLEHVGRPIYHP